MKKFLILFFIFSLENLIAEEGFVVIQNKLDKNLHVIIIPVPYKANCNVYYTIEAQSSSYFPYDHSKNSLQICDQAFWDELWKENGLSGIGRIHVDDTMGPNVVNKILIFEDKGYVHCSRSDLSQEEIQKLNEKEKS